MDESTLLAASRRFPLLSRPRPACPSLAKRVQEIAQIAQSTRAVETDVLMEATHALNKAALVVSDADLAPFARDLCWQQINIFRDAGPALTVAEVGYMLAPVLNLARLSIRSGGGNEAVDLLEDMLQAVKQRSDLEIEGRTLPIAKMVGTREEHRKLHEWAWKACIADGVRAFVVQARWDEAVRHAEQHRGIGRHLMEGRQAAIVAECLSGRADTATRLFEESTLTEQWEQQVATCLDVMCTYAAGKPVSAAVLAMVEAFQDQQPVPGYAPYYARLGLSVATLASALHPDAATRALVRAAEAALKSGDGYGAREIIGFKSTALCLGHQHHEALVGLAATSGLGAGPLPEPLLDSLLVSVDLAEKSLLASLKQR
jgi:hypothetical protein